MKKKNLMFTIMIMALAMSATSVMAESLKKIPVTAESQVFWMDNSDPDFRNDLKSKALFNYLLA